VNQAQEKALRFYPSTPTCEKAIKNLQLAQDLLIDVSMLMGVNWQRKQQDQLLEVAGNIGNAVLELKKMRATKRWSR
jgi:hypothetical protein